MRLVNVLFCATFIIILLASLGVALESGMCVNSVVTSIVPSSIEAGKNFTVGIEISGCGAVDPGNIIFSLEKVSSFISVQEPPTIEVGSLEYGNSKRFIIYHMRTSEDIEPGTYYFETKLTYGEGNSISELGNFSVDVLSDRPSLTVSGIKTDPDRIYPNQDVVITMKIQNDGLGDAKSVRVKLDGLDFEGVKEAYLGQIKTGEELPARFVLRSAKDGPYTYNIKVFYDFAGNGEMVQYPAMTYVFFELNPLYWIIPSILVIVVLALVYVRKLRAGKGNEDD